MSEVQIKPLEWVETVEDTGRYASAKTRVGGYDAFEFTLTTPSKTKIVTGWTGHWKNGEHHTPSFEEAKAEAQADYEARIRSALLPDVSGMAEPESFQARVAKAHLALFHDDPTDVPERVARFFEEALETVQAFGMTPDEAEKLLDYTFSRPVGWPTKEVGAAFLTLTSLCVVAGIDASACAEADLEKLQRPETIARIRAKRSTRHGRGPLPGVDPEGKS